MVLFLRNKRLNFMLFWGDYYLRWWRLPIEERACRKTDLGGGDYYLRNSGLPPSIDRPHWLSPPLEKPKLKIKISSDKYLKGTVVNPACNSFGRSFGIPCQQSQK